MNANRNLQDFLTEFRRQNPASLGIPINDREAYHQALRLLPRAVKLRALVEEHAASLQAASDGELEGMLAGYANGGGLQDMTKGYVYFDDGLVANVRRALLRDILQAMPEAQRMPFLAAAYRRGNLASRCHPAQAAGHGSDVGQPEGQAAPRRVEGDRRQSGAAA